MRRFGGRQCSVPQCKTSTCTNKHVSFHQFPFRNASLFEKWKGVLNISKVIGKSTSVCGRHFSRKDFRPYSKLTKNRRLKDNAIPSRNLPVFECFPKNVKPGLLLKSKYDKLPTKQNCIPTQLIKTTSGQSAQETVKNIAPIINPKVEPDIHCNVVLTTQVKCTQTDPNKFNFLEALRDDNNLERFAGVNYNTLSNIENCVTDLLKVVNEDSFSDVRQAILLVLVQLKLNLSFSSLAILFDVRFKLCSNIFFSMLPVLSVALENVNWPKKHELVKKTQKYLKTTTIKGNDSP